MKVNINISDELLEKVDEFAKKNYLTRTSFVNMVLNDYFNSRKTIQVLSDLEPVLKKVLTEDTDFNDLGNLLK